MQQNISSENMAAIESAMAAQAAASSSPSSSASMSANGQSERDGFAPVQGSNVPVDDTRLGSPSSIRIAMLAFIVYYVVLLVGALSMRHEDGLAPAFVVVVVGVMTLVALRLMRWVLAQSAGTAAMREVSEPIREGATAFLHTQYGTIARIAALTAAALFVFYFFRRSAVGEASWLVAIVVTCSFIIGAACSALSGYVGMWIAVRTNVRVTAAAASSYNLSIQIAMSGGVCSGLLVVGLCTLGLTTLFVMLRVLGAPYGLSLVRTPPLLIGFTFGASFVALFAQLGGGIYTKAADVGADIVGKVEAGIPEDDPRNPATIADLVGDNVGDCAGRGADLFESIAAEMLGSMIIGSQLSDELGSATAGFLFFPLALHALDLLISTLGLYCVRTSTRYRRDATGEVDMNLGSTGNKSSSFSKSTTHPDAVHLESGDEATLSHLEDPLAVLKRGYYVALFLSLIVITGLCRWLLYVDAYPQAWWHFALCGLVGVFSALANLFVAQYFTDYAYAPVREIAAASTTGHGTNIIQGLSVGMRSTMIPALVIGAGILLSHALGENALPGAGLYGTSVATMGMLSTAVYVLGMDAYGPVADNAGGIAEMSRQPEFVRAATDRLDAVGNTTKAATKGFAVGSAGLASFLLFSAFMDVISEFSNTDFHTINFAVPDVFVGGLFGAMLVFVFTGYAMTAVSRAAQAVVVEVRRQFDERPGIMNFTERPDYARCVAIVTRASLKEMMLPGLVAVSAPCIVGFIFKIIGSWQGRAMLAPTVLAAFLMIATICGLLMGLFLNNAGGAWDNAKKYVELGAFGGKNSEAHKAAVTGDTVGDPFKDTAGPSLHVLVKMIATVSIVIGPLLI